MSLKPMLKINDKRAKQIIYSLSIFVFLVVVALDGLRNKPEFPLDFNVHYFATFNAFINGTVFILLLMGVGFAKKKNFVAHKNTMFVAIGLSGLFLIGYIIHHLFAGSTPYGGEGVMKVIYYALLLTHIPLAGLVLPFILFAVYRGLTGEYEKHKKVVRWTYPLWLYVTLSGVLVYLMITPYYNW